MGQKWQFLRRALLRGPTLSFPKCAAARRAADYVSSAAHAAAHRERWRRLAGGGRRLDSDDPDRTAVAAGTAGTGEPWAAALPPGTLLGEFELKRVLGVGGFGIVYLAFDRQLHRHVAIKEYLPNAYAMRSGTLKISALSARHQDTFEAGLRSFIQEARLLARFEHPALVKVLRFWESNGTAYMAMPHYQGRTLRDVLKADTGFTTEADLRRLISPLLDAVALLHAEQCFHRDISPENIIIQPTGAPVLLDFGAARRIIGDGTQALTVVVKPNYAPIEQYAESGDLAQGPWTDVYGFAAVMYAVIMRAAPPSAVARVYKDPLQPLARVAPEGYGAQFLRGIDAGLAVRPEGRPQSIDDFREVLGLPSGGEVPSALMRAADDDREPYVARAASRARADPTVAGTKPKPSSDTKVMVGPDSRWVPPQPEPRPRNARMPAIVSGVVALAVAIGIGVVLFAQRRSDAPVTVVMESPVRSAAPAATLPAPPPESRPADAPVAPAADAGPAGSPAAATRAADTPAATPVAPVVAPVVAASRPAPAQERPPPGPAAPAKAAALAPAPEASLLQKSGKAKDVAPHAPVPSTEPNARGLPAAVPPVAIATAKPAATPDAGADLARAAATTETGRSSDAIDAYKDFSDEGRRYAQAADRGDAAAQVALGRMYASGKGAPRSDAEAARWFRKAADQGSAEGSQYLGILYADGRGVARDPAEAAKWYRKAADQGNAVAQNNLGAMYAAGVGVPRDDAEAVKWYRRSAEQGNASAQVNLGGLYALGQGLPKDEGEAVAWYRKAAEQGNARAQNNLAVMYTSGQGVARDEAEAARWYRRAAEQGSASAQYNLGVVYASGRGVMKDEAEAVLWYRKAAAQGHAPAIERLKSLDAVGAK